MTTSCSLGILTSMFFRLCSRAPWTWIAPFFRELGAHAAGVHRQATRLSALPLRAIADSLSSTVQSLVVVFGGSGQQHASRVRSPESSREEFSGVRLFDTRDFFWGADRDDFAACVAGFGTEIDDPIGGLDHLEIVLDHHDGMTAIDQPLEILARIAT